MTFHLEDIEASHQANPRTFLRPNDDEIANLKIGEMVRLFFVFNFTTEDGCRAERMWVELTEINNDSCKGYLTNQPAYIKDIQIGDIIDFKKENIATVHISPRFDESQKAIITPKALEEHRIDWVVRGEDRQHETDSGWQLFFGDESQEYLDSCSPVLVTLNSVLAFEPRLETVFAGGGTQYEWNETVFDYIKVE